MNALKMIGKVIVVLALIVLVIMGISQLQQFATQPREQFLQGQMEARRVLVAGKVPGRIEKLLVHEGDMVRKDSLVAVISSPEIEAPKVCPAGQRRLDRYPSTPRTRRGSRGQSPWLLLWGPRTVSYQYKKWSLITQLAASERSRVRTRLPLSTGSFGCAACGVSAQDDSGGGRLRSGRQRERGSAPHRRENTRRKAGS